MMDDTVFKLHLRWIQLSLMALSLIGMMYSTILINEGIDDMDISRVTAVTKDGMAPLPQLSAPADVSMSLPISINSISNASKLKPLESNPLKHPSHVRRQSNKVLLASTLPSTQSVLPSIPLSSTLSETTPILKSTLNASLSPSTTTLAAIVSIIPISSTDTTNISTPFHQLKMHLSASQA
jgi:hypothetical protein